MGGGNLALSTFENQGLNGTFVLKNGQDNTFSTQKNMFCNTLWATTHQIRKWGLAQLPLYKESEKRQASNVNIFCKQQRTNLLHHEK